MAKTIGELKLGRVETARDKEIAIQEMLDKLNELIRAVNQLLNV